MTRILPQHLVALVCDRPQLEVVGMIGGETTPESTGGRGGWSGVSRMRRSALVEWVGPDVESYTLVMRVMTAASGDVDAAKASLERMARMPAENVAPPLVRVRGLVPIAGRRCAVQDVAIEETERDADGKYTSFVATISLLIAENTGDGVIVARRVPAVHVAKKGDTIAKLALRYYGAARHAGALAKAQKPRVRDVRAKLKPGRSVRLP